MPTSSAPTRSTGSTQVGPPSGKKGGPPRRKRDPKEKRLQGRLVKELRNLGFFVSSFSQPRRSMQTRGIPDLFVTHARFGIACWIEVKAPDGKVSTAQRVWHRNVDPLVPVLIVRSVEELIEDLKALGAPIG